MTNTAAQLLAVCPRNRLFARRVDLHQQQRVGVAQHLYEVFVQVAGPAVAVRLIEHDQASLGPAGTYRLDHRCNFARVVAVVINQHHFAVCPAVITLNLEATTNALEAGQPINDGAVRHAFVGGDGNGRQRVQYAVHARHVDRDLERLAIFA